MRAESFPGVLKVAFAVKVEVEITDDRAKAVRIVENAGSAVIILDADAIGSRFAFGIRDVQAVAVLFAHRDLGPVLENEGRVGLRQKSANLPFALVRFNSDRM